MKFEPNSHRFLKICENLAQILQILSGDFRWRVVLILILKQAGLEEVEEDIVELENLVRVNFLVVGDEVELDSEEQEWE